MTTPEGFRFKTSAEARFADVDLMGHVNNAKYFTYMEQGRILYFDEVIGVDREGGREGVILASAKCDYRAPLFYRDVVAVWVRVSRLGNKSFTQEYVLVREADGEVVARGETVTAAYDYKRGKTIPLPERWREKIVAYEPALEG